LFEQGHGKIFNTFALLLIGISLFSQPVLAQPKPSKLVIGLLPEINIFKQKQRFQLLGKYLSAQTGVPVEFTILSHYGKIIESFTVDKIDGAFFGSFTGALAIRKLGVVPLARPVNLDNTSMYHGYILVRKDSGIKTVADMRGKSMAFVDVATSAGYIFPLTLLRKHGILDIDGFFSEIFFTGSHDAAVSGVLNRQVDVGAVKDRIYERARRGNPRIEKELSIIARSAALPSNGLCVRPTLDTGLQEKLKQALLNLGQDPADQAILAQVEALRFIETAVDDYQPVFDLVQEAGIDINKFNYRNK
jgi:phosphonate transport system substrate-binding protein